MSEISCKVCREDDSTLKVLSPGVGRARMLVTRGQRVVPGQALAEFSQLGRTFTLVTSEHGQVVSVKDHEREVAVAYDEEILSLDQSAEIHASSSSTVLTKKDSGEFVKAPMDGCFYLQASPNDPPFVQLGAIISKGQTLGLIEVMKCFYPIVYEGNAAKIVEIRVKNGVAVTSGTQIYGITKT